MAYLQVGALTGLLVLVCGCAPAHRNPAASITGFDAQQPGALPEAWTAGATNPQGPVANWAIAADPTAPTGPNVLALSSTNHSSSGTFNLCWMDRIPFRDGTIELAFKAVAGEEDQGGGPIWRVKDANNYYICRANPLEGNFRLYFVKDGARKQLASAKVEVTSGQWHQIKIAHIGTHIECWLNGIKLLEADDATIPESGGVGVWTKADAVTWFDDICIHNTTPQ